MKPDFSVRRGFCFSRPPLSFPSPRDGHQRVHVVCGERRVLGHVLHPAINRIEDLCENQPMSQGTKRFETETYGPPPGRPLSLRRRRRRALSRHALVVARR